MCVIYINHIPGNILESITPKNFGFSDSAEAFVFLSGVSLALAYGARVAAGRVGATVHSVGRRVVRLYVVHLLLSLAAVAIFALGAMVADDEGLMEAHGRALFMDDPWAALLGLVSLGHQLGYFNILPLYIVLMALLPLQLVVARFSLPLMLAASAALYALARASDWNIPTWPMRGAWFFDPLAWQLLMAVGIAAVLLHRRGRLPRSPFLLVLSGAVVIVGLLCVTDAFGDIPGLNDWTRGWADLNKTVLGLGRLVHFLAVAYLLYGLQLARRLRGWPVYDGLCLFGRHSLSVFALLSLMAAAGQVVTAIWGHTIALDLSLVGSGIALLAAFCLVSEAWPLLLDDRREKLLRVIAR